MKPNFSYIKRVINHFHKQFITLRKIYIKLTSFIITQGPTSSGKSVKLISSLVIGCSIVSLYAHKEICFPFPLVPYFWSPHILCPKLESCTLI